MALFMSSARLDMTSEKDMVISTLPFLADEECGEVLTSLENCVQAMNSFAVDRPTLPPAILWIQTKLEKIKNARFLEAFRHLSRGVDSILSLLKKNGGTGTDVVGPSTAPDPPTAESSELSPSGPPAKQSKTELASSRFVSDRLYISPEYTIFFNDVTKQQIDSGWNGAIEPNLKRTNKRIEKRMRGILSASGRPVLSLPCKNYPYDEDYFYINFVVDENATICYVSADVVEHLRDIRSSNFYFMILNGIELDCHCNRVLGPGSDYINILGSNFLRAVDASIMCDWSNCKMELVPSTARELPRLIPLAQGVNGDCYTRFAEITEEDVRSGWGGRIEANLSPGTLKSADAGALTEAPFQRPIISLRCHTPGKDNFNVAFVIDRHRDTLLSPEVISSLFGDPPMATSTEPLSVFINSVQVDCGVSPALERHINFLGRDYLKRLGLSMQIDWEKETFRMVEAAEI